MKPKKIYSNNKFHDSIQRECALTDRRNGRFSLIIINLNHNGSSQKTEAHVIQILSHRLRSTDRIGILETGRIGALLPDTPANKASTLGIYFNENIPEDVVSSIKIYEYPSQWLKFSLDDIKKTNSDLEKPQKDNPNSASKFISKTEISIDGLEGLLALELPRWKRVMDILGASVLLIILFPILLFIGIFIKIVSPGPIFFKQERIGFLAKTFTLLKFRTMARDADTSAHENYLRHLIHTDAEMKKLDGDSDPRIIPGGKFLRILGIDELPQLINVVRGEMSLIGPRPCIRYEAEEYALWQRKRCYAIPGLTGLWQVNGKNKTTHNQMVRLDIKYLKKMSFLLDLKILIKTFPAILWQALDGIFDKKEVTDGEKN